MIEITESKLSKATDYAEKMLKYGGMLMQCLSEWEEGDEYGERQGGSSYGSRYGDRSRYGSRGSYGARDEEDWEDEDFGERRGRRRRDSMGRYR